MPATPDPRSTPLLLAALCLSAGIVLATWAGTAAGWGLAFFGALAVAAVLGLVARRVAPLTATLWQTLALLGCLVLAGGLRMASFATPPPTHISRLLLPDAQASADVAIEGTVATTPLVGRTLRTSFRLKTTHLLLPDTALSGTGMVQVTLAQSAWRDTISYAVLQQGDRVALRGTLRRPPLRRNPADFDYGSFLRRQGVFATLTVRDSADVELVAPSTHPFTRSLSRARTYLGTVLDAYISSTTGRQVMRALVLGDRTLLDADVREQFAQTGLMHLLAVSGLHVLLVGMVVFVLLRPFLLRLGVPRRGAEIGRAVLTMALLTGYAIITGGSPSVVRAVVMAAIYIGGVVLERPASSMNSLGAAACILLVARPAMLFEPGFQLSFAAVAGLVLLPVVVQPYLPERRHRLRYWVATSFVASLAATIATAPILLYHFGRLPLAGLVLNFAAIFVTMASFAAALLLCLVAWWPAAAMLLGTTADYGARLLVYLAQVGDRHLAWLAYDGYVTNWWALAALATAVLMLALWPYPRVRFKVLSLALALTAAGVWMGIAAGSHRPYLEIVFLDVGQGDAALVSLPGGKHVLVDAGLRDGFTDAGSRTILPHLRRMGIDRLDAVIITHPHADHLGGLPVLLQSVAIERVLDNGAHYPSALYAETHFWLDTLGVARRALQAGDTLALDPAVAFTVLAPQETVASPSNTNDASVVLRIAYGATSFLFAGDAETFSENAMVARYDTLLRSTVVKVGHHGSITSSTPAFVAHVQPAWAVVSVAQANVYRLPSDTVLARWQRAGATVHLTRDAGALWLRSNGAQVKAVPWKR